jgi:hypothetical protein
MNCISIIFISMCALLVGPATVLAGKGEIGVIVNGDFEDAARSLNGWVVTATGGTADTQVSSGFWRKCTVRFNSGPHTKVALYHGAYGSTAGRCWLDNLVPAGFVIKNPSFEELTADGAAPVGWSLDSPGQHTHVVTDRASKGVRSVMLFDPSYAASSIRISQIVDVMPNTEYSYTFDFYMEDDFYGAIRCTVLAADIKQYVVLGVMVDDLDQVIADRSFAGSRQARLRLDGGEVSLSQRTRVPEGAVLEASVNVKCKKIEGEVVLQLFDPKSSRVLASAKADPSRSDWNKLRTRFVSTSTEVVIRVIGRGKGAVLLDGVEISRPTFLPGVQMIAWKPAERAFRPAQTLSCRVIGGSGRLLQNGLALLAKDLKAYGVSVNRIESNHADLTVVIGTQAEMAPKGKGPQSYWLESGPGALVIHALEEPGAYYGLMTLLQLITETSSHGALIVGCDVTDWPDLPWRSLFSSHGAEWMARRKFNRVESILPQEIEGYRSYGITAIPHENITHFPHQQSSFPAILRDPNYAEGVQQRDRLTMVGEIPVELTKKNVLRTKLAKIEVRSQDGKTFHKEGTDYRIIPGDLELLADTSYFKKDGKPFMIVRIPGGGIPDGATVVVDYEAARGTLCLAELEPQMTIAQRAKEMVGKYHLPFHAFHVSETEGVGQGPRCRNTGLSPSQLVARYYDLLDRAVKEASPKCRVFAWTDDFMPWQNASRSGLGDVPKLMPKDAVMGTWYYGPGGTVGFNVKTARLWTELGHEFTLMGWYDYSNIRATAAVALWARQNGMPCLGTSSWAYPVGMVSGGSLAFLDEVARCAWRGARRGESGYIDVDAEIARINR